MRYASILSAVRYRGRRRGARALCIFAWDRAVCSLAYRRVRSSAFLVVLRAIGPNKLGIFLAAKEKWALSTR